LLLLALVGQYFYTFNYPIWDFYVFYISSYVLLALLAGAGVGFLLDLLQRIPSRISRLLQPAVSLALICIALWHFLPQRLEMVKAGKPDFPYDQYPVNWVDQGYQVSISKFTAALDENAILFTDWGKLFPLFYTSRIEQGRTDLQFLETYPQDESLGISQSEIELIQQNIDTHPIYFDTHVTGLLKAGYRLAAVWRGPMKIYKVEK
jgi:hypothetical protein